MKILAITDIHSSVKNVEDLVSIINDIDAIIVAGDVSHFGPFETAKRILMLLADAGTPVFFVPGNCDPPTLLSWEDPLQHIYNLHGKHRKVQGYFFAGVGGGIVSPFNTFIEFTEDEYSTLLSEAIRGIEDTRKVILVAHNPPHNTRLDVVHSGIHVGSHSVRKFVEKTQPLLLITGHIHESRGIDRLGRTLMVNPGPLKWGYYALIDLYNEKIDIYLNKL